MKNTKNSHSAQAMKRNSSKAASLLKQLASAPRLMILCSIVNTEKTVGELHEIVDLSQSSLSQHLAKLRKARLVSAEKRGQMVYYRLESAEVQAILSTLYLIYCR
jgi:ArsR family transcriptional regulator